MRFIAAFAAAVWLGAAAPPHALAQEQNPPETPPVTTARAKTVIENDRLRMLDVRLRPGEKVALEGLPNRLLYMMSDGALVFAPSDRMPYELTLSNGEAVWVPPLSRSIQNDTQREVRALIFELKDTLRSAGARKAKSAKRGKRRGKGKRG